MTNSQRGQEIRIKSGYVVRIVKVKDDLGDQYYIETNTKRLPISIDFHIEDDRTLEPKPTARDWIF